MTTNVGNPDRLIRGLVGFALIVLPVMNLPAIWSSPVLTYGSMGVGLVLVITALIRFCPLYRVLGLSTCRL